MAVGNFLANSILVILFIHALVNDIRESAVGQNHYSSTNLYKFCPSYLMIYTNSYFII